MSYSVRCYSFAPFFNEIDGFEVTNPTKFETVPTGLGFLCRPCHRIPCGYPRPSDFCLTKQQHPSINVQLTKALFSSLSFSFFQPNATHEVLRGLLFGLSCFKL